MYFCVCLTAKKQKHDMVHVEVWLGDGPKTIGARWQKGKVQVFDSYRFVSKSYHNMVYHFKSIDTWLQGICRRYVVDDEDDDDDGVDDNVDDDDDDDDDRRC